MKRSNIILITVLVVGGLLGLFFAAQQATERPLDQVINEKIEPVTEAVSSVIFYAWTIGEGSGDPVDLPFVVVWLILAAIFFTVYMGFVNLRSFGIGKSIIRGDFDRPNHPGEVTHFQALTAALSATVGLGNIAGVAIAISMGGPGATFWMIIGGFFGMTTKFVECTLGVKYRLEDVHGTVSGGPMYYLSHGLARRGWGRVGMFLASFFCVMCIGGALGGGNIFQINQASQQFVSITGGEGSFMDRNTWLFGLVIAALVGLVIIGGIKSIARVTEKIVPIMCGVYLLGALIVIFSNFAQIPDAISLIFREAFQPEAVGGGFVGVLVQGLKRSAFSNEAGIGSASIAHSAVKTDEPVTEGIVALFEPFVDTIIVCTMTALVIVITGTYEGAAQDGVDGIMLTSSAFESVISWFPLVLSVAVILFAFSTMLTWSYYGLKSWTYLFGNTQRAEVSFKLIFCCVIILGSLMSVGSVIQFSYAMIFAMCFPNVLGLLIFAPEVKRDLISFRQRVKSGEIYRKEHK